MASSPLRVKELAELLAFDFKAGSIPKFNEDCRLEDPVDAVLSTCSSLLAVVDVQYPSRKVIQFSHFSVKEYLTSNRLAEASDIIPRRYHVSMTSAHTLTAKTCLGILLHLDKDVVTRDNLEKWPLAEYAAKYWVDHALFEGVSQNVEDGLKQLFDPRKAHLAVCVWIYDPYELWGSYRRPERPLQHLKTYLHYAAFWGFHFIVKFLVIECSQNVGSRGFSNNVTPLHLASGRGHVKTTHMLIELGASVMAQDEYGETPLHSASHLPNVELVRMLIERSTNLAAQDKNGETPLHLALQYGNVEVARMLIERGADLEVQNKDGMTPLHVASCYAGGVKEVVCMLIERGADVAAQDKDGNTPLHVATKYIMVEFARVLVERSADVDARNNDRETPLHMALGHAEEVEVEAVCMLIESGADVAAQDNNGDTSLHLALQRAEVEIGRMLIGRGADVAAQNKDGVTPLHLALDLFGEMKMEAVLMLIEDMPVAAQNKDGETPLHLASQYEEVEVVRMLIERGADVSAQNKEGETPLHRALEYGNVGVVRMLIESGTDVSAQNKDGMTPLHLASLHRRVEAVRMLIEHGADVAAQNKNGETPLHRASQYD